MSAIWDSQRTYAPDATECSEGHPFASEADCLLPEGWDNFMCRSCISTAVAAKAQDQPLEALAGYLSLRHSQRMKAVDDRVERLSTRELRLVREAAVMGYVTGVMCGPYRDGIPNDTRILKEVIDRCMSNPDLYPTLAGQPR